MLYCKLPVVHTCIAVSPCAGLKVLFNRILLT